MKALREKIEHEIREHGPIPFSRYMELCLYDEEFGYYSRNADQFGKSGDFYTSSDVHAVFGRLMARQFEEMWRVLGSPEHIIVRELGPGRGLFARDVLDWSAKKFPDFFQSLRYVLVEKSPALRKRIDANLREHLETGKAELDSRDDVSATTDIPVGDSPANYTRAAEKPAAERRQNAAHGASRGDGRETDSQAPKGRKSQLPHEPTIVFANEFFDAIPVEVVSRQGSLRIDTRDGHFVESWIASAAEELEFLDRYSIHPEPGDRVEVPLQSQASMKEAAGVHRGFIIAIDYGYTREEQLAGRHRGTLKAIRQHAISANPYEAPGEQDITADVNFTALAAAAQQCGMHPQRLVTQSQFLMGIGETNQFADAFEDCRLPQERAKVALQLKHLVTPAGMGESFHVCVASNGVDENSAGSLLGLTFGTKKSAAAK